MPRNPAHLSITLPRNFTFHYSEGEEPKTPEQEDATPTVAPPPPPAYRVKRLARPRIRTSTQTQAQLTEQLQNAPIPTIETPAVSDEGSWRPLFPHRATEPSEGYLSPATTRPFLTMPGPRTPTMQRVQLVESWRSPSPKDFGESIARPLSRCSINSDSSDESIASRTSYPSLGGSCTSPESDAPDPFFLPSIKKSRLRPALSAIATPQSFSNSPALKKTPPVQWTSDMDRHLWSTYMQYLQDPTVTPFKALPGTAPPLGVCHRVARQAKRTWRGPGNTPRNRPETRSRTTSAFVSGARTNDGVGPGQALQSGSSTPTGSSTTMAPVWPKSSSSTRRRLRELAKNKPSIAPHYQRLLRSPSPLSSSSPSQPRSSRAFSPLCQELQQNPFQTRDIQLSLTTSTSATMQRNGPLAQLTQETSDTSQRASEWFNDPPVPWASPPAIPSSDLGSDIAPHVPAVQVPPRLGSPFSGAHTWGPSRSRQHLRPSTPRTQSSQVASTIGPTLRSPLRFNSRAPYPSVNKRRAQHQLEDELSPGGSDTRKNLIQNLFGEPSEARHRRVRSRGFSLGDVKDNARFEALFQQQTPGPGDSQGVSETSSTNSLQPPGAGGSVKRLGSPFSASGSGSMPNRRPSRHLASASLSAYDPGNFASIDQRIRQSDLTADFLAKLRE
ncbi:MAG: hypothetical protein Q9174_000403 [Haloplaca sp. 1 TL-2023]